MKTNNLFISVYILIFLTSFNIISQDYNKIIPENNLSRNYLLNQIREARLKGDKLKIQQLQSAYFNKINYDYDNSESAPEMFSEISERVLISGQEDAVSSSLISSRTARSVSTAVVPQGMQTAGRIWVAAAGSYEYPAPSKDTLCLYYSSNNGITWIQWGKTWSSDNLRFRDHETDMEIITDGTDVWIYVVSAVKNTVTNKSYCYVFKYKTTGTTVIQSAMLFSTMLGSNVDFYCPKIASDNMVYTTWPYLYITASFDSVDNSGKKWFKEKFGIITSPFATSLGIYYRQAVNGSFYFTGLAPSQYSYLHHDAAYYFTGAGDRIFSVIENDTNLYLSWSDDYGFTNYGNLKIIEGFSTYVSLASIGTNSTMMLVFRKRKNFGYDGNLAYMHTTTGGTTLASWNKGIIDSSQGNTRNCSVISVWGSNNSFKTAYQHDENGTSYHLWYSGWGGSSWNSPPKFVMEPYYAAFSFSAGYRIGGEDSCFAVWTSGIPRAVYGCGNSSAKPKPGLIKTIVSNSFSLMQNYPNPFNPSTKIRFSVPEITSDEISKIKLVIFDNLGREVIKLVNENLLPGVYEAEWNGSNFSSGVYYYKLTAGDYNETRKMLLIK